jgi:hypothetical protein
MLYHGRPYGYRVYLVSAASHNRRLESLRKRRETQRARERELTADLRDAIAAAHADGVTPTDIARRLGMSRESLYRHYLRKLSGP